MTANNESKSPTKCADMRAPSFDKKKTHPTDLNCWDEYEAASHELRFSHAPPATTFPSIQQTIHHPKLNFSSLIYLSSTSMSTSKTCLCLHLRFKFDSRVKLFAWISTRSPLGSKALNENGLMGFGNSEATWCSKEANNTRCLKGRRISMEFYFTAQLIHENWR